MKRRILGGLTAAIVATGCGTVDPGASSFSPQLLLDEDMFYCVIQPSVINAHECAQSGCHGSAVSLALEPSPLPECVDGRLVAPAPPEAIANFEEIALYVQGDPSSSPFYRAPIGEDGHTRIFDESSDEAAAIAGWIVDGTGL